MKVYVVTADTYDGAWGASISLIGVFSDKAKAEKCVEKYPQYHCDINEVDTDKEYDGEDEIYIGGYIE